MNKQVQIIEFVLAISADSQITLHWEMDKDGNHRLLIPEQEKEGNWANWESPASLNGYIILTAHWKDLAPTFHSRPFVPYMYPIVSLKRL